MNLMHIKYTVATLLPRLRKPAERPRSSTRSTLLVEKVIKNIGVSAVAIAETKSINKAAEQLYVGQSALSRAVKELEAGLGVTLFERSAKGMFPTPDGEIFVRYARTVLKQVDMIENMFSNGAVGKKQFSISVPRASYIASAFAQFSKCE